MLNASIINPKNTFTEFSHPPDLGNLLIIDGNKAKTVNGNAKAIPNPAIPIVGRNTSPAAASTSKAPTMGPVHENDTITVVNPIKNRANIPPLSTFESAFETHFSGKTISNAPKNEAAKTIKRVKNIILGIQWMLRLFANPAPALVNDTIMPND
jgi:hypothetical protein